MDSSITKWIIESVKITTRKFEYMVKSDENSWNMNLAKIATLVESFNIDTTEELKHMSISRARSDKVHNIKSFNYKLIQVTFFLFLPNNFFQ